MTEQVDLDALIAEALDGWAKAEREGLLPWKRGRVLASALSDALAELRQERERADAYRIMQRETAKTAREMRAESDAALSRAEATIEKLETKSMRLSNASDGEWIEIPAEDWDAILTEYDKQKGADRDPTGY